MTTRAVVSPRTHPRATPALPPGRAALLHTLKIGTGPTISPAASRLPLLQRTNLPQIARRATRGIKTRVAALPLPRTLARMTALMTSSGITPRPAAFPMADHPATPILPPVRAALNLDGTGVAPQVAAFLTIPTLLLPIALRGRNGTLGPTSVVQSQPLHLRHPLNLLTTTATMAMGGSGPRSSAQRRVRTWPLQRLATQLQATALPVPRSKELALEQWFETADNLFP